MIHAPYWLYDVNAPVVDIAARLWEGCNLLFKGRIDDEQRFSMPLTSRLPDATNAAPTPLSPRKFSAAVVPSIGAGARRTAGVSKVAWIPSSELVHSDWLATGRRLGAIGRCSQWWIGDWIRYGTARWGEKYAEGRGDRLRRGQPAEHGAGRVEIQFVTT